MFAGAFASRSRAAKLTAALATATTLRTASRLPSTQLLSVILRPLSTASAGAATASATAPASSETTSLPTALHLANGLTGSVREVVAYPHPVLQQKAQPVADYASDRAAQQLVADLFATAQTQDCLGIAAPQLGVSSRVFVMKKPLYWNETEATAQLRKMERSPRKRLPKESKEFVAVINPVILSKSEAGELGVEACLSVPDNIGLVRRSMRIEVSFMTEEGKQVRKLLGGLPAIIFQHEYDHLEGLLLTDREVKVVPKGTLADATSLAEDKWMLGLMKWYGVRFPHRATMEA